MLLEGKVAFVTGAARNVGKGIARRFAREGAHVVLNDVDADAVSRLADEWEKEDLSVSTAACDMSDAEAITSAVKAAADEHGRLDVLVNNAVVLPEKGEREPFLKLPGQAWREFTSRNLDALFFATQAAARIMARQRSGSIISISSNGAIMAHRRSIAYDSVKGALEAFTRAVAVDLGPWGVRVNAIRPIAVREVQPAGSDEAERDNRLGEMVPLGRIARPRDVAWAAVFLAADDGEYVTGQVITVDGGMLEQSRPPQLELGPVAGPEDSDLEDLGG